LVRTVPVAALLGASIPSIVAVWLLDMTSWPIPPWPVQIVTASFGAAIASALAVRRAARRLDAVARFLEMRIAATSTLVRREHEATQRERKLAGDVARKSIELEQRLLERALLFDVLRESASSHDLDSVLRTLVERLGVSLRFREVAVLLRAGDATEEARSTLVIRAVWGFEHPNKVLGRQIRLGEGLTGEAAEKGTLICAHDVEQAPGYLAFWDEVQRTGSFMSVPIRAKGELIGMLALTRPKNDPITALETSYIEALGHQVALAIRNAQLFAELQALSTQDALTGLANRRLFETRLTQAIADAHRFGRPLSLLAIDVDHFKHLNDRHGHPEGDAVLIAIARLLAANVRAVDTAARIGGEEFAVILAGADENEAAKIGEKLRRAVAALDFETSSSQPLGHLSISVGVTQLKERDCSKPESEQETAPELIARADAALYDAKRFGRDRVSTRPPPR
jgi:diguanylate cyclase (GGDEF)-like protein